MVMTMIILPMMYLHPSIKDTLPQRSVIASQSQLCLDNPSSKCSKRLSVPRTAGDCPRRAVWRQQNLLWQPGWLRLLNCLSFQQLSLTSKSSPNHPEMIPKPTLTFEALLFERGPERQKLRYYFQMMCCVKILCPELPDVSLGPKALQRQERLPRHAAGRGGQGTVPMRSVWHRDQGKSTRAGLGGQEQSRNAV